MLNRFNIELKTGYLATCQHARGGHVNGVIVKIEHEDGRGRVITLDNGHSFSADDVQECTPIVYDLGIDVRTRDASKLISRLKRLKTTCTIENGGAYREDVSYSQIYIKTLMSESELDEWLYRAKHGADYVGVYSRSDK